MYTMILRDEEAELFFEFVRSVWYGDELLYFFNPDGSVDIDFSSYQLSQFLSKLLIKPYSDAAWRILDAVSFDIGIESLELSLDDSGKVQFLKDKTPYAADAQLDWISGVANIDICEGYYG